MKMKGARSYLPLLAIYVVLVLPAAGALLVHQYTNNPFLKPLGITKEKIMEIEGQKDYVSIFVHVDWGVDRSDGATRSDLRNLVESGFRNRTDDYVFRFRDVPGDGIGVSFVVGRNRYGPFPTNRLLYGINPALAALELTKRSNK